MIRSERAKRLVVFVGAATTGRPVRQQHRFVCSPFTSTILDQLITQTGDCLTAKQMKESPVINCSFIDLGRVRESVCITVSRRQSKVVVYLEKQQQKH